MNHRFRNKTDKVLLRNIETCSRKNCCCGQAISVTCSECMLVHLFISNAKRMRRIVLPSVVCLTVTYYSTFSHKRPDFRKTLRTSNLCVLFSLQLCNFFYSQKNSSIFITHVHNFSLMVSAIPFRFQRKLNFYDRFS
jgi:hypothetical protein